MQLEPTIYYPVFLEYFSKAEYLQTECNLGGVSYSDPAVNFAVNDELMQSVHIYDTVHRVHAGFCNVLQQLWHGIDAPKSYKWGAERIASVGLYRANVEGWTLLEWFYAFIAHRATGSGASFEEDHGYRNNVVQYFDRFDDFFEMSKYISEYPEPIFTSIGNQPPSFKGSGGGRTWLRQEGTQLAQQLMTFVMAKKRTIRETVDFMNSFNTERGYRRFNFVYTAIAMDIADYFPQYVGEDSVIYYGSNAQKCLSLLFNKPAKVKDLDFFDSISQKIMEDTGSFPKDSEDVACDFVRYLNNYVPNSKMGTYDSLVGKVKNSTGIDPSTLPETFRKYGN